MNLCVSTTIILTLLYLRYFFYDINALFMTNYCSLSSPVMKQKMIGMFLTFIRHDSNIILLSQCFAHIYYMHTYRYKVIRRICYLIHSVFNSHVKCE